MNQPLRTTTKNGKQKKRHIMDKRSFMPLADMASLPNAARVAKIQASGQFAVNIDGVPVATVPAGASDKCAQKTPIFCAGNQKYATDNGWACAIQRSNLYQQGF